MVFRGPRVAVFIDGCFWHGCPEHGTAPRSNAAWWRDKLEGNRRRDETATREIEDAGWTVIRIWEHEDPDAAARRVTAVVRKKSPTENR